VLQAAFLAKIKNMKTKGQRLEAMECFKELIEDKCNENIKKYGIKRRSSISRNDKFNKMMNMKEDIMTMAEE
jgi:hypothetical protein